MHVTELVITIILFALVTGIGFWAARWKRPPHLHSLDEWSLAGRKFGPWIGWFMLGGDLYTAYTFVAVPALLYGTRNIYKEYLRRDASDREQAEVSKITSLVVKAGAILFILGLQPQFSINLQLIGGVIILQTLPAVFIGLYTRWPHRLGLLAGWVAGMGTGVAMLYVTANPAAKQSHWGGSAFALSHLGIHTTQSLYTGFIAVVINLLVTAIVTVAAKALRVPDGTDETAAPDYYTDEADLPAPASEAVPA